MLLFLLQLQVLTIVQLVGIVFCLSAAAKISHRAQGLGSVVSRWHAIATCNSTEASQSGISNSGGNLEAAKPMGLSINYSESDLESSDYCMPLSTNTQLTSNMSSYHKRQAFGTFYLPNYICASFIKCDIIHFKLTRVLFGDAQ